MLKILYFIGHEGTQVSAETAAVNSHFYPTQLCTSRVLV